MKKINFNDALVLILKEDTRYPADAYFFVREALDFTFKILKKPSKGPQKHVTAADLLNGIRQYALREYGPMAMTVFAYWGIHQCVDFGRIVFNLVNKNILRKTESDSIRDFEGGYDFAAAFRGPYQAAVKGRRMKAESAVKAGLEPTRSAAADRPSTEGDFKK
jgi:uncharacterized repeat protein (TIGR04138 family)